MEYEEYLAEKFWDDLDVESNADYSADMVFDDIYGGCDYDK